MQLAKQLDDIILGGRFVAEVLVRDFPKLADATLAVHQRNDQSGRRREAMDSRGSWILQQIPDFTPIAVTIKTRVRTQLWPPRRHSVPPITEKRDCTHVCVLSG